MTSPFDLSGRRVLVTGASSGIGRACAVCASRLGAGVVLTGRRASALEETRSMCVGDGHTVFAGELTAPGFVDELADASGKIDGLVHAAGVASMCPAGMLRREDVESVMRTNFVSFMDLARCFSKARRRNSGLSIVAVSSVSANAGWAGGAAYCASKGAVSACVRALAVELAPKGVRVNAVCPSNIHTPLYEAGASAMNSADSLTELLKRQPLGLGEPEQVAWPVCFLLSDAASFITGVNMPVDGGYLAQ